jgi:hypothetical protein
MKVIKTNPKVEFSTKEFQTLEDARILLADLIDLLDDGDNILVTDKIEWAYHEIDNAIVLLDELAHDEVTIIEEQE